MDFILEGFAKYFKKLIILQLARRGALG